ncbi:hypothetical protein AMECASPLE_006645 [Ameca splendens]|uniref:Uncharacterized protein n=1 Tax=Ameca splendens TaxID=208324 RepID=A0ABV0XNG7_9TELE
MIRSCHGSVTVYLELDPTMQTSRQRDVFDHRMDDLGDFLRQREIPEETIETMLKEKIDTNVIQLMTDEELKSYLSSYGDRLALLGYCKSRENGTPNSHK